MYCRVTPAGAERYTLTDLRRAHPQVSWPRTIADDLAAAYGVFPLQAVTPPPYDAATHRLEELSPAPVDGVWTQQWAVQALSPEEVAAYAATKRAELHVARREARTVAETGGFTFSGHPVDSDRDSILRINNAATTAITASLTASPFATVWKCGDDYEMSLDAAGVMALQAALSAHGQACHDRSNALCALIDDPQADLHAVAAEMGCGWPTR